MPFCINCGTKLPEGAKFCYNCGNATVNNEQQRQQEWAGKIVKCPFCGEPLSSFTDSCPACGQELRGMSASKALCDFVNKIEKPRHVSEKAEIISNFPIPNTKEDIWEFLILASAQIRDNQQEELTAAWESKIEQAHQKAQLIISNPDDLNKIQEKYDQIKLKIEKLKKLKQKKHFRGLLSELSSSAHNARIVAGWLISLFILLPLCGAFTDKYVGVNFFQVIFFFDIFLGTIFVPRTFKSDTPLPKMVAGFGLALIILLTVPPCLKNLDNVGFNPHQFLLFTEIICSIIIIIKMFGKKYRTFDDKTHLNKITLIISLCFVGILIIIYGVTSIFVWFSTHIAT